MAGMVVLSSIPDSLSLTAYRAAEQSEGNKVVGVDPTIITARKGWRSN